MSACAVAQAADASEVASESMERPTAVKLTMLFSTFFQASNASARATRHHSPGCRPESTGRLHKSSAWTHQ